jgi:putative restriction endonuclease
LACSLLNWRVLALKENSLLPCEICQFSLKENYGETGEGFIEGHHIFPISQLTEETETKLEDLILLCSNCHRMIHRKRPWVTRRDEIKELFSKNA